MAKREFYTIELDRPDGVSVAELIRYMREALEEWGGQRHPDDPLFCAWKIRGAPGNARRLPAIRITRRYP